MQLNNANFKAKIFRNYAIKSQSIEATLLANQMDAEGPFHAFGFFTVQQSSMTGLVSTMFTYLLVIMQFKSLDVQK